jgi:hypothetical protein
VFKKAKNSGYVASEYCPKGPAFKISISSGQITHKISGINAPATTTLECEIYW